MIFGVYAVRDVHSGFQSLSTQANDAVAARGFESAVQQSESVLFTHADDFTLCKIAEFDSDTGRVTPCDPIVELVNGGSVLK